MNYSNIYDQLIHRAIIRQSETPLGGYTERHHIIPRSHGGSDDFDNIAILTPEEHYLAHLLLVKMHPTDISMIWAVVRMTGVNGRLNRNNKLYGWARRRFSEAMKKPKSEETRQKMSEYWTEYRKNNPVSDEAKEAQRQRMTGHKHSDDTKRKMSDAKRGVPKSEEHKQNMSKARKGKATTHHDEERRRLISENMKKIWEKRRLDKQNGN